MLFSSRIRREKRWRKKLHSSLADKLQMTQGHYEQIFRCAFDLLMDVCKDSNREEALSYIDKLLGHAQGFNADKPKFSTMKNYIVIHCAVTFLISNIWSRYHFSILNGEHIRLEAYPWIKDADVKIRDSFVDASVFYQAVSSKLFGSEEIELWVIEASTIYSDFMECLRTGGEYSTFSPIFESVKMPVIDVLYSKPTQENKVDASKDEGSVVFHEKQSDQSDDIEPSNGDAVEKKGGRKPNLMEILNADLPVENQDSSNENEGRASNSALKVSGANDYIQDLKSYMMSNQKFVKSIFVKPHGYEVNKLLSEFVYVFYGGSNNEGKLKADIYNEMSRVYVIIEHLDVKYVQID